MSSKMMDWQQVAVDGTTYLERAVNMYLESQV